MTAWPAWHKSLTVRTTALFMLIVTLAAAGLGAYLYRTLVDEIERRDDLQLLGKLRQVQLLLARPGAADLVRRQPDFFRDTMSGQENSLVRFIGPDGAVLADINAGGERFPAAPRALPAMAATPDRTAIADWTGSHGAPGRVVAGAARLADGRAGAAAPMPAQVTVVVARLYAERTAMLAGYRGRIVAAVAVSALIAALCAGVMLHRGLRPLRRIAAHADRVRPGALHLPHAERLDAGRAPSELVPLVDALNAMLGRLQEGYARLSGFSADLAHEFRTPITNLLGQSQVLLAQPRSVAEYEQLIASNIEELERLARMIDSMLFLARAGQADL
ncbi:MAG: histidine kinase dimerization/phospho-acceptor domain-containing protein, partial [Duganella sp.]